MHTQSYFFLILQQQKQHRVLLFGGKTATSCCIKGVFSSNFVSFANIPKIKNNFLKTKPRRRKMWKKKKGALGGNNYLIGFGKSKSEVQICYDGAKY